MSLEEFNNNFTPLISLAFSITNFVALFLLYWQIRLTQKWNQLQSKYNFIDTAESPKLEKAMLTSVEALDVHIFYRHSLPLQSDELQKIFDDVEATVCMNHFINDMQNLCASLNYGIINKEVFHSIHIGRVRWWYNILKPYVFIMRENLKDDKLWLDFEKIGETGQFNDG